MKRTTAAIVIALVVLYDLAAIVAAVVMIARPAMSPGHRVAQAIFLACGIAGGLALQTVAAIILRHFKNEGDRP